METFRLSQDLEVPSLLRIEPREAVASQGGLDSKCCPLLRGEGSLFLLGSSGVGPGFGTCLVCPGFRALGLQVWDAGLISGFRVQSFGLQHRANTTLSRRCHL